MRVVVFAIVLLGCIATFAAVSVEGLLWLAVVGVLLVLLGAAMALLGALVLRS